MQIKNITQPKLYIYIGVSQVVEKEVSYYVWLSLQPELVTSRKWASVE